MGLGDKAYVYGPRGERITQVVSEARRLDEIQVQCLNWSTELGTEERRDALYNEATWERMSHLAHYKNKSTGIREILFDSQKLDITTSLPILTRWRMLAIYMFDELDEEEAQLLNKPWEQGLKAAEILKGNPGAFQTAKSLTFNWEGNLRQLVAASLDINNSTNQLLP